MAPHSRYLVEPVIEDLAQKMVFVDGPRQVGKTTLSNDLVAQKFKSAAYFNWDNRLDRTRTRVGDWPGEAELIILDEIHKFRKWKSLLKGEYDKLKTKFKFLVTGSSRLDVFRRGGDSLQGRYHHYRLHPFSLAELVGSKFIAEPQKALSIPSRSYPDIFGGLMVFGGFPEPFLAQNSRTLRRWHLQRHERLFREDIRDLEVVHDLAHLQLLADILPSKVQSLLSTNSLREDLEVSHKAVSRWLKIFESFYYSFRIYPFAANKFRSLKKEPKLYLWDWSEVPEASARFENMIASHLLKFVHFLEDHDGYRISLRFLRDTEGREVDFIVLLDEKPWFAVEVKTNDTAIDPALRYFRDRIDIPYLFQVVQKANVDRFQDGIRVISADRWLGSLR